jgi:REP element-mobilizing transposase RayT
MGRSRYRILQSQHPHFLTCTVLNWIPLFTRPATVQIVLDALLYRQQQHGWCIYGYVILENHLHLLVQADDLPSQLAHFKSYTARQLIDYLHEAKAERLLEQLKWFRKAHKTDRDYQLWEEGSHPQLIDHTEVLRQKLDYIHLNPVKRGYVDLPEHWRYSSARDYAGLAGLLPVYRDWF